MKNVRLFLMLLFVFSLVAVTAVQAQDPVEVRITWYDDGNEGEVLRDLLDRFEAENPDITVVVDTVPYASILEQLPLQVEAGEAPDIARVTNLPLFAGHYLDMRPLVADADYWDSSFPPALLQSMRTGDDTTGIYGFPNQFTVTGPYINRTLFEQAGVEVPSDTNDAVTWQEWTDAAVQVAEATETPYAMAFDRSGHRFAGPAISMGATILDADGNVTVDSPGLRAMADVLIGWHTDGITPAEVWVGSGDTYSPATNYFLDGQVVFYMAGSWQVQNFANTIGDAFDWEAVPNPTGPGGSTGMPGGTGVVAFANTEHPAEVARVMDYLASEDVLREFSARTLFIPGQLALASEGIEYETDSEAAKAALDVFLAQVPNLSEQGYWLNAHPQNGLIFNEIRDRLGQVLAGELTLDEAIERAQENIDAGLAAAQQ